MPEVGGEKFGYGPEGLAKAKAKSEKTGLPVKVKKYQVGGLVKKANDQKKSNSKCRGMGIATRGGSFKNR